MESVDFAASDRLGQPKLLALLLQPMVRLRAISLVRSPVPQAVINTARFNNQQDASGMHPCVDDNICLDMNSISSETITQTLHYCIGPNALV